MHVGRHTHSHAAKILIYAFEKRSYIQTKAEDLHVMEFLCDSDI